ICSGVIGVRSNYQKSAQNSARDASGLSSHQVLYVLQGRHGRVTRSRHGQCAVCRSTLERPLDILGGKKTIQQTGGEGIAAAHAIVYLHVFSDGYFVKLALSVAGDCRPIISTRSVRRTQGYGNQRNVGKFLADS